MHSTRRTTVKVSTHNKQKRIWLALVLALVTLVLVSKPVKTMLASLQYYAAKPLLTSWQQDPSSITPSNYIKAKNAMQSALALHPNLALYSSGLSDILQWGAYSGIEDNPQASYQYASELLKMSLQQRPVWALSWLSLAQIKWANNVTDQDFLFYMQQAHNWGENLPEVHILWANIGLQLINKDFSLFLRLQPKVKQHALLGLTHPRARDTLLSAIKRHNKQAVVCAWLKNSQSINSHTQAMLQKRLKC